MAEKDLAHIFEERLREAAELRQRNQVLYFIIGLCLGFMLFLLVYKINTNLLELLGQLVPEAVGIVFTTLILQRYFDRRDEVKERQNRLQQLVRQASSPVNDAAVDAIAELRTLDVLGGEKGILQGVNLRSANLAGANLQGVNLRGVDLRGAKLAEANLAEADLQGADLQQAELQNTNLSKANLTRANLNHANLNSVQGIEATLVGAKLVHTKATDANFSKAVFISADLSFCKFDNSKLIAANLLKASLKSTSLKKASLYRAILRNLAFQTTDLSGAELTYADLTGSSINIQAGWGAATIVNADTILPDGKNYNSELGNEQFKRFVDPESPDYIDISIYRVSHELHNHPFTFHNTKLDFPHSRDIK